jgi:hypothetical protein
VRARVDTNAFYCLQAFQASRRLFRAAPRYALRHRSGFRREARPATAASIAAASASAAAAGASVGGVVVVSATFAEFSMQHALQAHLPQFEYGNKVLLSGALLELLMRSEMEGGGGGGGGGEGEGGGEGGPGSLRARAARGRVLLGVGGGGSTSATGEAAMVFELLSPQGHPVYVGVAEFTSPEPFLVVAPQQVLDALRVRDGAELTVTRVNLPAAAALVLQPHAADFEAVEALTGKAPREFLEDSLLAYTCLQAGATLLCGGGRGGAPPPEPAFSDAGEARPGAPPDAAFRFTVVAVEPAEAGNGAVALFSGFQSEVAISFLPPADAWVLRAPAPAHRAIDEGAAERKRAEAEAETAAVAARFRARKEAAAAPAAAAAGAGGGGGSAPAAAAAAHVPSGGGRSAPIARAELEFDPAQAFLAMPMLPTEVAGGAGAAAGGGRALGGSALGGSGGGGGSLAPSGSSAQAVAAAAAAAAAGAAAGAASVAATLAAEREARRRQQAEAAQRRLAAAPAAAP